MGSPISGHLAEAALQKLETRVLRSHKPKFWMRYADDTSVVLHRDAKEAFRGELNYIFPQIQFTMEGEKEGTLSFLDAWVTRQEDGTLQTGVFRKATNTEKILTYNSNHPLSHKRYCVRTLFRRINTHCNTEAEKLQDHFAVSYKQIESSKIKTYISLNKTELNFRGVVRRPFNISGAAIDRLPQMEKNAALHLPPYLQETIRALQKLSRGKASGPDAIPTEIYKHGGFQLMDFLTAIFQEM
ncbi:hypothetical protein SprV_0100017100 [Sparganum proliferum]